MLVCVSVALFVFVGVSLCVCGRVSRVCSCVCQGVLVCVSVGLFVFEGVSVGLVVQRQSLSVTNRLSLCVVRRQTLSLSCEDRLSLCRA